MADVSDDDLRLRSSMKIGVFALTWEFECVRYSALEHEILRDQMIIPFTAIIKQLLFQLEQSRGSIDWISSIKDQPLSQFLTYCTSDRYNDTFQQLYTAVNAAPAVALAPVDKEGKDSNSAAINAAVPEDDDSVGGPGKHSRSTHKQIETEATRKKELEDKLSRAKDKKKKRAFV